MEPDAIADVDVTIRADFSLPGNTPLYRVNGEWVRGFRAEVGVYRYRLYGNGTFFPDPRNAEMMESKEGLWYNVVTVR